MNKISCVINTYNEEKNIEACINSIKWCDEIIIVDTGSTDRTTQIAKKFTPKIFYEKFENDFSILRNKSIKRCIYDWVLIIDADETYSDNSGNKTRRLLKITEYDAFCFPRRQYIRSNKYLKYGFFYPDYQTRLFRHNIGIKYFGLIHEQPIINHNKIKKVYEIYFKHNHSRSKYKSFFSYKYFLPYVNIESKMIANSYSWKQIFLNFFNNNIKDFYRSYVKLRGYKDGYDGFRASFIHSIYILHIFVSSIKNKIIKS